MDDLARLVETLSNTAPTALDKPLAIATVVNTRGSAYRRAGARMIVHQSMTVTGAVSAGCLERDIIAHCEGLTSDPRPLLLTYDGQSSDDLIFGLKLGCDGIVQIFVEPVVLMDKVLPELMQLVPKIVDKNRSFAAVTIFAVQDERIGEAENQSKVQAAGDNQNELACVPGLSMLATDSEVIQLVDMSQLAVDALGAEARAALALGHSVVIQKEIEGQCLQAFIEIATPVTSLLIFGSGQDVEPLIEMAGVLGWRVTVATSSKAALERFGKFKIARLQAVESSSDSLLLSSQFVDDTNLLSQHFDACVIMTHDYDSDKVILHALLNSQGVNQKRLSYIGMVGPKRRAEKVLAELALLGVRISEMQISRLFSPIGLDIGAERPEEIALSILAEIKAVLSGHSGNLLRVKSGPIHEPAPRHLHALDNKVDSEDVPSSQSGRRLPEQRAISAVCHIADA